ncbi:MAG: efflux transporter outer membrane subunit [Chlamydiales bacterium]|nr:efflux transporter outer membrane subunit [Chlamydiales bacterium]
MKPFAVILLLLFISSCHVGPRYEGPSSDAPADWKGSSMEATDAAVENWWDIFCDEKLDELERLAIENNRNLYMALEKVAEARAVAGVAKSTLYPQVYANPAFNNLNELIKLYGVPQSLFPGLKTISRVHEQSYLLPVTMSYEVDLWGKYRGTYNAATIYAQAKDEAVRVTLLTITTEVASHYFNLRAVDTQIALLEQILNLRKELFSLIKSRYQSGLVSYLDYLDAEKILADTDAEYQESVRQRSVFENALASLLGTIASGFCLPPSPLLTPPPPIPSGIPSEMLMRRPDLAQAERAMAGFHELISVAYSTYFPSILLTSALGFSSPDLSQFLNWTGRLWQIGIDIAQVIFNGGRNRSYVEAAYARFREAKAYYEQTVFTAFQEVEDALNNVEQSSLQFNALQIASTSSQRFSGLSELRNAKGLVNSLDTLSAQRAALDAERTSMNALGRRYQAAIQLIKALGGGWEGCSPYLGAPPSGDG